MIKKIPQFGNPDPVYICTRHFERLDLTVRMKTRRFTRLTNAHGKSEKHHATMQAIFSAFYNFCRKHETLNGATPAMASQLVDKPLGIKEFLENAAKI